MQRSSTTCSGGAGARLRARRERVYWLPWHRGVVPRGLWLQGVAWCLSMHRHDCGWVLCGLRRNPLMLSLNHPLPKTNNCAPWACLFPQHQRQQLITLCLFMRKKPGNRARWRIFICAEPTPWREMLSESWDIYTPGIFSALLLFSLLQRAGWARQLSIIDWTFPRQMRQNWFSVSSPPPHITAGTSPYCLLNLLTQHAGKTICSDAKCIRTRTQATKLVLPKLW